MNRVKRSHRHATVFGVAITLNLATSVRRLRVIIRLAHVLAVFHHHVGMIHAMIMLQRRLLQRLMQVQCHSGRIDRRAGQRHKT